MKEGEKQPLAEHLRELRGCLIRSSIALLGGTALSLFFTKEIFEFLQKPLTKILPQNSTFIATSPLEAVVTYLKVGVLGGLFLASPFVLYQLWRFVAPALYVKEKKFAITFVAGSSLLFLGGALFGYAVIFPLGFRFFVAVLAGTDIQFLPQMKDYLGFVTKMLLTFGVLFELPLLLVAASLMGVVTHQQLAKARRYVIVLVFLVAGLLTPGPDVLSQFLMAIPLLLLYEISLLLIRVVGKKRKVTPNAA